MSRDPSLVDGARWGDVQRRLAHLQQDSLQVRSGQWVDVGDVVGRCGNSGRSSQPHLHYHLQTTSRISDGEGLPAQFTSYCAGGLLVTLGEPGRGQTVIPGRRAYGPAPRSSIHARW